MIIGLDVGGTHTDAVLLDAGGLRKDIKILTDPSDLFHCVLSALEAITDNLDPAKIQRIVLSTTLTTNAIVQNKIPPVAMIVSSGPGIDPEFYRTGPHYFTVAGCIDHRGREIEPINPAEIHDIASRLKKEGIDQVGVVGKFSVRNPTHEERIGRILQPHFKKIFMGHRVSGNLNFTRRIATTFLNAAVYPIHKKFYQAVQDSLAARGLHLPLRLLKADGGNMRFEASADYPAQTILSGPAASAMGAVPFGRQQEDCLVLDIGGTTTDMAVLIDRVPVLNPVGIELTAYKTLIRSLETLSIGLGADSAVVVKDGKISIGPQRLGAAMAYGGTAPTPTDALFVMQNIAGGDRGKAIDGLKPLAQARGVELEQLATEIIEVTCRKMLSAAGRLIERMNSKPVYTLRELQEGYVVRPQSILLLGGPAPQFAPHLEAISGLPVQVLPKWEVANAIGAALARTTCDVIFFADTEQQVAEAPEENFSCRIDADFDCDAAVRQACELLRSKAIACGANSRHLEIEVAEAQQFNMVRGFYTTGRNIRVRVQVRPGVIHGYDDLIARLATSP